MAPKTDPSARWASLTTTRKWLSTSVFLALSAVATYYMRLTPAAQAAGIYFTHVAEPSPFIFPGTDVILRRSYTGIGAIDATLSFLVAAFFAGAAGWNEAWRLQQIHFLFSVLPVIAVWSVETMRQENKWSLISFTSIWALFYQTVGGGIIIPFWYICFTFTTSKTGYWDKTNSISPSWAKTLLPALVLGYLIPTTVMYLPNLSISTRQALVAFWQPSPLFVNLLWYLFATFTSAITGSDTDTNTSARSSAQSASHAKTTYLVTAVLSALVHIGTIITCLISTDPSITLWNVFMPTNQTTWTMDTALHFIFQADFWTIFAACMVACYQAVLDVYALGKARGRFVERLAEVTVVAVVLGPGAAFAGTWYWREGKMQTKEAKATKAKGR